MRETLAGKADTRLENSRPGCLSRPAFCSAHRGYQAIIIPNACVASAVPTAMGEAYGKRQPSTG